MRVAKARRLTACGTGPGEAAITGPARDSENWRNGNVRLLVAIADRHGIIRGELLIDLYIEVIDRFLLRYRRLIVRSQRRRCGGGKEAQDLRRGGTDAAGRDKVALECLAARPVRVAGGRVVNLRAR